MAKSKKTTVKQQSMSADDWRGFTTNMLAKLPTLMMVLFGEQMQQRVTTLLENVEQAEEAVMEAAKKSADLFVEAAVDVLNVFGEGNDVPVLQTRGLDIAHDATIDELVLALTPDADDESAEEEESDETTADEKPEDPTDSGEADGSEDTEGFSDLGESEEKEAENGTGYTV